MQQTAPLKLPPSYEGRPNAYFYDKTIWTKEGLENNWIEQPTYHAEQWGVHYIIAWRNENGEICRRLATMEEWLQIRHGE